MTIKMIACEVIKEELLAICPERQTDYEFISAGLHLYPKKLKQEIQNCINKTQGYSEIILAFGLCGGAAKGLQAVNCPIIMPRVHDCFPLLLGSKERYAEVSREKGNFYLSYGWMNIAQRFMDDYRRILDKQGAAKADKVFAQMFEAYQKVVFIETGRSGEEVGLRSSKEFAALLKIGHHALAGRLDYIRRLVNGPWDEADFIRIMPPGQLEDIHFGL